MPAKDNIRIYKGQSMACTFKFGDRLLLDPTSLAGIRPGDVVVYWSQNNKGIEEEIVHRVIRLASDGLVVQGDNNLYADKTLVTEANLVGRVSFVERDGKIVDVSGRSLSLLCVRIKHGWRYFQKRTWNYMKNMGRGIYFRFRNTGMIGKVWRPSIQKMQLMTDKGPMVKYVCRNRTVAQYWPKNGFFKCRKPYDLVLWNKIPNKEQTLLRLSNLS